MQTYQLLDFFLQINFDGSPPLASFRRNNLTKIRKISNDNLATHMNINANQYKNFETSDDVEEFRRKTPNRLPEQEKSESLTPNAGSKSSTKKSTGWGTDLDSSYAKQPPFLAKCEPCNYTGKSKSALYQHNQGQKHKNNMKRLTQSMVSESK